MLRKFRETLKNKQRGAIMVFFAILVPLFLGVIGLAVDAGFLYMQKAKLQDVADATALAGAGHLKDENREKQVKNAVEAFAGANGYKDKDKAVSSNFQELADKADASSVTLEENAAWKIAYAIDTGMIDKDAKEGELRDHVRVVILKRVPTFFIRMLFPEQQEVVVKAVAAAEYVEGEEPVVSGGAKIYCAHMDPSGIYDNRTIEVDEGRDFSLYIGASNPFASKIPYGSTGTLYNTDWNESLPDGWNLVRTSRGEGDWNLDDPKEKIEKETLDKTRSEYKIKEDESTREAGIMKANIEDYKNNVGNKRYIGYNEKEERVNTIKDTDTEIELYMDGTDIFDYGYMNKDNCLLYNDEIKNVTKITKLLMNKQGIIDTSKNPGVIYGDIYVMNHSSLLIMGSNNKFEGRIYVSGQEMYVAGEKNTYALDTASIVTSKDTTLKIGQYKPLVWYDSTYYDASLGQHVPVRMCKFEGSIKTEYNSKWKMEWYSGSGSGGSSSGSSGSGASKAHVRLVI